MPDFNIKNSSGHTVGSIEEKTDWAGIIGDAFAAAKAARIAQAHELLATANYVYDWLNHLYERLKSLEQTAPEYFTGSTRVKLANFSRPWTAVNEELGNLYSKPKKFVAYFQAEVSPYCAKAQALLPEISSDIDFLEYLTSLENFCSEFFALDEASTERLASEGLSAEAIADDSTYVEIHTNYATEFNKVVAFYNAVIQISDTISNGRELDVARQELNSVLGEASDIEALVNRCRTLLAGREEAIRRILTQRPVATIPDISNALERLAKLKAEGQLSETEFQAAKQKLLES